MQMSKGIKIILAVLVMFAGLTFLHVWLNIGFEKLRFGTSEAAKTNFRVGFLPVT
jgi:hypothetical protein